MSSIIHMVESKTDDAAARAAIDASGYDVYILITSTLPDPFDSTGFTISARDIVEEMLP